MMLFKDPISRIKLLTEICIVGFPVNVVLQTILVFYKQVYFGHLLIIASLFYGSIFTVLCIKTRKNLQFQRAIEISQMLAFALIFTLLGPLAILGAILILYLVFSKKKSSFFKLELIVLLSTLHLLGLTIYTFLLLF